MTQKSIGLDRKILRMIVRDNHITLREIQAKMEFGSSNTANYHVGRLIDSKFLERPVRQKRPFIVTKSGMKFAGAKMVKCSHCSNSYLMLLDEN